jgi:transcriptional regulator with XRE-family HTH domain
MPGLGETIRASRTERRLTLAELARASGLTKGFLSQVESGRSNPSLQSLSRIAQALGTSSNLLLAAAGSPSGSPATQLPPPRPSLLAHHAQASAPELLVLGAVDAGTPLLVKLTPTAELAAPSSDLHAVILCAVLDGSAQIAQAGDTLSLPGGSLATWDAGLPYALRTTRSSPARLLLFLPRSAPLPALTRLPGSGRPTGEVHLVARTSTAAPSTPSAEDGPLKLVAMRARRLAERKRNP